MKAVAGGSTEPRRAFRAVSRTGGTPGPARTREGPGNVCPELSGRRGERAAPEAGARSVPYRALGTSTGPRPPLPPPGPASTSPPYFSSILGIRSRRRCPRCGVSSCLAAAAEHRAQTRHSPMPAAPSGPRRPGCCRCPRLRLTSTRASGLGRGQFRRRRVSRRLTASDGASHVIGPSSPHSRGSARPCACAQYNTRRPLPFLRLFLPLGYGRNPRPVSAPPTDEA